MVKRLKDYLNRNNVNFVTYYHNPIYSAEDLAMHLNAPLNSIAKTYLLRANGEFVLLAIPACCEIDIDKLRKALSMNKIDFPPEASQEKLFPDCEADALPPFGNLYGIKVYVDDQFGENAQLIFPAGSFRDSVKVKFSDFKHLVDPVITSCCRAGKS